VNFRALTLAVLSLSLAASLGGTLLGLFVDSTEAWQLAGTAMILTVMSGIWAVATRGGDAGTTPVVLTIVIGSGASAAFFCAAVWIPLGTVFGGCVGSGAACLGATVAGALSMRALAYPLAVRGAWVAFGLQMAGLLLWLLSAWAFAPGLSDDGLRGWILMGASPIAFLVCFGDPKERGRGWQFAGLALLGVATLVLLGIANDLQRAWTLSAGSVVTMRRQSAFAIVLATLALVIGMGRIARHARGGGLARALHLITISLTMFQGFLLAAWIVDVASGDTTERVLVAFPAMILSGAAISAVLDRMARSIKSVSVADITSVQCECPRCKHRQPITVDGMVHPCIRCGLGFSITLTQRQCFVCAYDLTGSIGATTCPECGSPVVTQPAQFGEVLPPPPAE
jgi:hypothetical protein